MTSPLSFLLNSLPSLAASIGCFNRIQDYLLHEDHVEKRLVPELDSIRLWPTLVDYSSTWELITLKPKSIHDTVSLSSGQTQYQHQSSRLVVTDASFGYDNLHDPVLHEISFELSKGSATFVLGPVGSGKTSLIKGLLGEIPLSSGHVAGSDSVAYCSQDAWLLNTSVRNSIVGGSEWDEKWYLSVLDSCALRQDIDVFPARDMSLIGSRGAALSGGQK